MTKIEWTDESKNPVKGICPVGCSYCYAIGFYKRFKWNPEIRFEPKVLDEIKKTKKPCKFFVGSTIDLFHPKVKEEWRKQILETIKKCPHHIFQILTKLPQNLSLEKYPDNLWIGISCDGINKSPFNHIERLYIADVNIKFLSLEPYLQPINPFMLSNFDWVIVGGQTGNKKFVPPKIWIDKIIKECRNYKIPVFVKDNCYYPKTIQEFPT